MIWITEDPSSGNLVQYLAKITRMVDMDIHVNGHDRTILVILAKYCTRLWAG